MKLENKQKKIVLLSICALVVLLLLSFGAYSYSKKNSTENIGGSVQDENQKGGSRGMNQLQDVDIPERDADVSGVVTSISGNKVTIMTVSAEDLSEVSSGQEFDGEGGEMPDMSDMPQDMGSREMPQGGGSGEMPQDMGEMPQRSEGGSGMRGGNSAVSSEVADSLKDKSTGEEEVVVPVGIQMYRQMGNGYTLLNFSDLTEDSVVQIWFNQDVEDQKIAEFVIIK